MGCPSIGAKLIMPGTYVGEVVTIAEGCTMGGAVGKMPAIPSIPQTKSDNLVGRISVNSLLFAR